MTQRYFNHPEPVLRGEMDFILCAHVPDAEGYEQLAARQVEQERFEICCVPFFLYDIAVGDIVSTHRTGQHDYVVDQVIEQSGRYVFRAVLRSDQGWDELRRVLEELTCRWEHYGRLVAIDSPGEVAQNLADALQALEDQGHLEYETGRL